MKREDYINILKSRGFILIRSKKCSAVIAFNQEKKSAVGWSGKSDKPNYNYRFLTLAQMEKHISKWIEGVAENESRAKHEKEIKKQAQSNLNAKDHYKIGDVYYNTWGYEQTNVDFYQIVRVGKKCVYIQELKQCCSDKGGPYGGRAQPRRNEFKGEPMRKNIVTTVYNGKANFNISMKFGSLSLWDGTAVHCSSYH